MSISGRGWFGLVLFSLLLLTAGGVDAQLLPNPFNQCCPRCRLLPAQCNCPAPCPAPACVQHRTKCMPVEKTRYRKERMTTYRDVVETTYRQEAYYETIPTTVHERVVVDEGSYQQVWVPKVVTKTVPKTVYQQRLNYRSVPQQVMRKVPQVSERLVPERTVQFVPQTVTTTGCGPCGTATTWGSLPAPTAYSYPPISSTPTIIPPTVTPTPAMNIPQTGERPVPTPTPDPLSSVRSPSAEYEGWTDIQSRQRASNSLPSDNRIGEYEVAPTREARRTTQRSGMFVPAPSATAVWQSQSSTWR